jgi:hypothetical protein
VASYICYSTRESVNDGLIGHVIRSETLSIGDFTAIPNHFSLVLIPIDISPDKLDDI